MRWMIGLAAAALAAGGAQAKVPQGIWQNPAGSVRVSFFTCGHAMCGRVVWASPKAQADAEAASGERLVGTILFRDFDEEEPYRWTGTVLVPDLGREISGTIMQTGPRTLVGEGCMIAGLGCRQQTWTRVK